MNRLPKEDFSVWQGRRTYAQNGTQCCNHCLQSLALHRYAHRTQERLGTLQRRLRQEKKERILHQVRNEILDIVRTRASSSCHAGVPQAEISTAENRLENSSRIPSQPVQKQATYDYVCPFCHESCRSRVYTGKVDHRNHCGKQFMVTNGVVSGRGAGYKHKCPKCGVDVLSSKCYGQIRVKHKNGVGRTCSQTTWTVVSKENTRAGSDPASHSSKSAAQESGTT